MYCSRDSVLCQCVLGCSSSGFLGSVTIHHRRLSQVLHWSLTWWGQLKGRCSGSYVQLMRPLPWQGLPWGKLVLMQPVLGTLLV